VTLLLGFLGLRFQVGGLRDNVVPEVPRLGEKHGAQCDATKVVIEYVDDRFEQGHDRGKENGRFEENRSYSIYQGLRILK
jgi:hypothetical protein